MTITSFGPANRIARTAETHPLTWRLRDDGEPSGSTSTRPKTAMRRRARR